MDLESDQELLKNTQNLSQAHISQESGIEINSSDPLVEISEIVEENIIQDESSGVEINSSEEVIESEEIEIVEVIGQKEFLEPKTLILSSV
jgi:hypothetical protein